MILSLVFGVDRCRPSTDPIETRRHGRRSPVVRTLCRSCQIVTAAASERCPKCFIRRQSRPSLGCRFLVSKKGENWNHLNRYISACTCFLVYDPPPPHAFNSEHLSIVRCRFLRAVTLHLVSATIFHPLLVIQLWETDRGQLGACQNRPTTPAGDTKDVSDMCDNVKKWSGESRWLQLSFRALSYCQIYHIYQWGDQKIRPQ